MKQYQKTLRSHFNCFTLDFKTKHLRCIANYILLSRLQNSLDHPMYKATIYIEYIWYSIFNNFLLLIS